MAPGIGEKTGMVQIVPYLNSKKDYYAKQVVPFQLVE